MFNLITLLEKTFINESVNRSEIESAIKNRKRVALSYTGDPTHGVAPGVRYADIYSLIETKAGNIAIRAYQPYGDTATSVPNWKIFRLDRIQDWVETPYIVKQPAPGFNPHGDAGANRIIMIANFGGNKNVPNIEKQTTTSEPYRTETEKEMKNKMDNLRNKLSDPVYIDQFLNREKENNKIKNEPIQQQNVDIDTNQTDSENNINNNINKQDSVEMNNNINTTDIDDNIFKTDTEKQMERLRQQLNNPTFIDDFLNKK